MSRREAPNGFKYVAATEIEIAEWKVREHKRNPLGTKNCLGGMYCTHGPRHFRLECLTCGKRIWGAGMAIGSHRKSSDCLKVWHAKYLAEAQA